jgi:hypothetical protein
MGQESPTPQINVSKIPGGGGFAGALFALAGMLIFLVGIPRLRLFLLAAAILGCGVALVLRHIRRETPGKPWILPDTHAADIDSSPARAADNPPEDHRRKLQGLSPEPVSL